MSTWQLLKKNRLAILGLVFLLFFFLFAIFGLIVTSGKNPIFNPYTIRLQEKLKPPFSKANKEVLSPDQIPPFGIYIFGTDDLGRDVFSRMLQGAWVSLTVGFVSVGISTAIGIIIGGIAGYYGKEHPFVDILITGMIDIMLCFPSFFLVLTVMAFVPGSIYTIMAVIGLTNWMGTARFVRAEFLSLREQDFILAAKALGLSEFRIIFRHMLPNAMAPVLVSATLGIASAILIEAGLSFLGFGVPPPYATWGGILSDGRRYLFDAPWLTFIPGIAILFVVLSFNLFGEGLRDALNPRLRE